MTRYIIVLIASCLLVTGTRRAFAEDDSKTMDLAARPNQLPSGYAEYGVLVGFPGGPERDPPVDEWKYAGLGSWITTTMFARVGVSDRVEVDALATLAVGHPENTPGARANRFGGVELTATYKLSPIASVMLGASYVDPWLAMYGQTTFQHYFMDSEAKVAGHVGGRFGTTIAKRFRLQAAPRLTVVAGVDTPGASETWILLQLMARADTRVFDDVFMGLRTELRTGDKLSLSAADGATLPVIAELRYVMQQVDLGFDVGLGSVLTSQQFPSRVAYANVPGSFYLGAVMNWRLD